MTKKSVKNKKCHCEERSDVAISIGFIYLLWDCHGRDASVKALAMTVFFHSSDIIYIFSYYPKSSARFSFVTLS